jgi:hypothetical protein
LADAEASPGLARLNFVNRSNLVDEPNNWKLDGTLEQALRLTRLGEHWALYGIVKLEGTTDENHLSWNRKYSYALLGELRYSGFERSSLTAGLGYSSETLTESNTSDSAPVAYLNWYTDWDIAGIGEVIPGRIPAPGSTWGELRFPASAAGLENDSAILEGAIEQGLDLARLNQRTTLNTYLALEYTFDSQNISWNNKLIAGPGGKFRIDLGHGQNAEIGMHYRWHHNLETGQTADGAVIFVNVNTRWDLGG